MNEVKKHKKIRIGWILLLVLLILAAGLTFEWYRSNRTVTTKEYTIDASGGGESESLRIVLLTDLHNSEFGEGNRKLVEEVRRADADLILITGDLLNSDEERTDIAVDLLREMVSLAPVYVSNGNHELEYTKRYGVDITSLYEETGAVVMEKEYLDVTVKGQELRIGGIYGYCLPEKYLKSGESKIEQCNFLKDMQDTDRYKILLCHLPICWMINSSLEDWDMDLVLAGHIHGGQIVLPIKGPLYAPDLGWFPGRTEGVFSSEDGTRKLVVSPGLGNTEKIPRFNNVPQVTVVDVLLPL